MQLDPQRCCCRKLGGDVSPISYPSRTRHATKTFVSGFVSGLESGSTFRNKFERDMPKNAKLRHPTCNSSNVADLNLLLVFPRLKAANTRFISFLYETSFHSKKLWKTFWKVDLRGHIFLPLGRFLPGLFFIRSGTNGSIQKLHTIIHSHKSVLSDRHSHRVRVEKYPENHHLSVREFRLV